MTSPDLYKINSQPIAVLGAGTLGRRIALMYATRGAEVRLYDTSMDAAQAGASWSNEELPALVGSVADATLGRIVPAADLAKAIDGAWLVTEAVPENLDLKRSLFADLDRLTSPDAILASNSSSFPSSRFVDHLQHPERVLNTHFLMPPDLRPVEIMSCGHTAQGIIAFLVDVLPRYGLSPYLAQRESIGFIYNRIWAAVKREALSVVADGVTDPETVDRIYVEATGQRHGPFRLMDQVGLDVVLSIEEHYADERPNLPINVRDLLKKYIAQGRLGVKSGSGFYDDYKGGLVHV